MSSLKFVSQWLSPENKAWQKSLLVPLVPESDQKRLQGVLSTFSLSQLVHYAHDQKILEKLVELVFDYLNKNSSDRENLINFIKINFRKHQLFFQA